MAYDEVLAARVRGLLGAVRPIGEKRMFSGLTFMVRNKMCVSVGKERIMCRIDPAIHDEALMREGSSTVMMKGREYRGFVHVAADAVKSDADLKYWVGLALDYNRKATASKRSKQRASKSKTRRPAR